MSQSRSDLDIYRAEVAEANRLARERAEAEGDDEVGLEARRALAEAALEAEDPQGTLL